jgi:hypothetical protein
VPSPKKQGHTALLVQVPDGTHGKADARRRRERVTWSALIGMLLQRWADGVDDASIAKPVKVGRPVTPDAAEMDRLVAQWMSDPAYAKAATERVEVEKLPRYRSLGELLAAGAAREGRKVSPELVAEADAVVGDETDR